MDRIVDVVCRYRRRLDAEVGKQRERSRGDNCRKRARVTGWYGRREVTPVGVNRPSVPIATNGTSLSTVVTDCKRPAPARPAS